MSGGVESPTSIQWLFGLIKAAAVLLPLLIALFGLIRRDIRLVWIGILTAVLVSVAWFLVSQREAQRDREIEALKKEIEATKSATNPRSVTPEQRQFLIDRLREMHGPSVHVLANGTDEETAQYARQIVSILKEAGWAVPASFGIIFTPVILPGQDHVAEDVVLGVANEVPEHITQAFLSALREGGIRITMGPHWPGTEHPISILVGPQASPRR
jgi:hypothetical protein